jgi:hypothetical protein
MNLTLLATLPNIHHMGEIIKIFQCPEVSEVRYNTGTSDLMSIEETLEQLGKFEKLHNKKVWIDLKGRQLRITKWADPFYDVIELNHEINLPYPAKIIFRNGTTSQVIKVQGNKIIVSPIPKEAVGSGQSINILSKDLKIEGYLTDKDYEVLRCCKKMGFKNIMASFVENFSDLSDILNILPDANIICKIESLKGMQFVTENKGIPLMAARDDLFIESGQNNNILQLLKIIIASDSNAICASRIFSSLKKQERPDLADYSDVELMQNLGYKRFMLDDNISHYHFNQAISAWKEVIQ